MTNFRTPIKSIPLKEKIGYQHDLLLIGSCFTENIGLLLSEKKFSVEINPLGIVYNPVSVVKSLEILIEKKLFTKEDLYFFDERWVSFSHHGSFSDKNFNNCLKKVNSGIKKGHDFLKKADFLFISLGTAWVYEYRKTKKIVANCHKLPAKEFKRFRLLPDEITLWFKDLIQNLQQFNPKIKIIFTVSPVRHIKDGLHENQLGKSTLLLVIDDLVSLFKNVSYFPSYEMVMDDLRDYRFYESDMLHPNKTAIQYIWEQFAKTYFTNDTADLVKQIEKIVAAVRHRAFDMHSTKHQLFVKQTIGQIDVLKKKYPALNFEKEMKALYQQLTSAL